MPNETSSKGFTISRRDAMIGGAFALASGIAYARTPEVSAPVIESEIFESWIPSEFGIWREVTSSGVVLPPPDQTRDRLYDNLVTRAYTMPSGQGVMMLLAYNNIQDGMLQVHRPEVCYSVGGFELTETQATTMQIGPKPVAASGFTAKGPPGREEVFYFTRLGKAFPTSWAEQRLAVMRANIEGDIPDGMMMRLSTLGLGRDEARDQMNRFASDFFETVPAELRRLLVGGE